MPQCSLNRVVTAYEKITDSEKRRSFQLEVPLPDSKDKKDVYVFIFPTYPQYITFMTKVSLIAKTIGVYGYPIRVAVMKSGWRFPLPMYRCLQYLRYNNGINEEGIFRLSPAKAELDRVKAMFNSEVESDSAPFTDNITASVVLKNYIGSLDDSLIPYTFYYQFIDIASLPTHEEQVNKLKNMISVIPTVNQNCLWYLCDYLVEVYKHKDVNKMTEKNLGVCFSPNIVVCPNERSDADTLNDSDKLIAVFALLITDFDTIFEDIIKENE